MMDLVKEIKTISTDEGIEAWAEAKGIVMDRELEIHKAYVIREQAEYLTDAEIEKAINNNNPTLWKLKDLKLKYYLPHQELFEELGFEFKELEGSEKQIAWAESLRVEQIALEHGNMGAIKGLLEEIEEIIEEDELTAVEAEEDELIQEFREKIEKLKGQLLETKASRLIDVFVKGFGRRYR